MPTTTRRFAVHAAHEERARDCAVMGESFEDAAMTFLERWASPDEAEVSVIVTDCETGRQQCLRVDLSIGVSEPCD